MSVNAFENPPYQRAAFQAIALINVPAFQEDAFQYSPLAFQMAGPNLPAFDGCTFQFDAFQSAPCPTPPIDNDSHDGGRKKRVRKKLQELEDKRIAMVREDGERRKMAIRFALDPQAKAEYEAKMLAETSQGKPAVDRTAEIAKIDAEIAKIQNLKQNRQLQSLLKVEYNNILAERQIRAAEIERQIREADDELALMMMM
jgi:hypothetical protein